MGDILFESAAPPLELPAPQPIELHASGATKVASFCLAGAAVLGWLSGCSSSESNREVAPLPPMPPSNPNSAPPSPEWSPTPPFVSPRPSAATSSAPAGGGGGGAGGSKVEAFQCTHIAEVDKLGKGVLKITVGGKGEVTSQTYTGVLEADGMTRLHPGTSFEYTPPDATPVVVVMPAGGVWTRAGKVLLSEWVLCGTIPR